MNARKTIGIIGGMGPLATVDLFRKIVEQTDAENDNSHIRIYIDNNTGVPDRTAAIIGGGCDPVPQMLDSVRKLEACGADCLIMPCNTAHYFLPRLQSMTKLPFLSMLDITAGVCASRFPGLTAGVLATKGTLRAGVYSAALEAKGVRYVIPDDDDQARLMELIYDGVKGGRPIEEFRPQMDRVLADLAAAGADYFILGCTELPIAAKGLGLTQKLVDPTNELARAAITYCGYKLKG